MRNGLFDAPVGWRPATTGGKSMLILGTTMTARVMSSETAGAFAVLEFTLPPHHPGLEAHLHRYTTELVYVVAGSLAYTLGKATAIARPGTSVLVSPGVAHHFWNPTTAPATYLAFLSPGGLEAYYARLAAPTTADSAWEMSDPSAMAALGQAYDHVLLKG